MGDGDIDSGFESLFEFRDEVGGYYSVANLRGDDQEPPFGSGERVGQKIGVLEGTDWSNLGGCAVITVDGLNFVLYIAF
ncbi:hypothetical protein [Rhodococcus globerulus]|uniref:Uncharacterized protein n=1 Tax=Rhodococcus globerulus TaxID=33008 RepID=A0ABU4C3I5_RHOGO|nr:hypothetical protein [Rhodococcus globerulus]MDV6271066.1 hypothetical protein [Rhodococcus globerulus]